MTSWTLLAATDSMVAAMLVVRDLALKVPILALDAEAIDCTALFYTPRSEASTEEGSMESPCSVARCRSHSALMRHGDGGARTRKSVRFADLDSNGELALAEVISLPAAPRAARPIIMSWALARQEGVAARGRKRRRAHGPCLGPVAALMGRKKKAQKVGGPCFGPLAVLLAEALSAWGEVRTKQSSMHQGRRMFQ